MLLSLQYSMLRNIREELPILSFGGDILTGLVISEASLILLKSCRITCSLLISSCSDLLLMAIEKSSIMTVTGVIFHSSSSKYQCFQQVNYLWSVYQCFQFWPPVCSFWLVELVVDKLNSIVVWAFLTCTGLGKHVTIISHSVYFSLRYIFLHNVWWGEDYYLGWDLVI